MRTNRSLVPTQGSTVTCVASWGVVSWATPCTEDGPAGALDGIDRVDLERHRVP